MTRQRAGLWAILLAGCSTREAALGDGNVGRDRDASAADAHAGLADIGNEPLDTLTSKEAQLVCEADARQTDFCMQAGLASGSSASCEAAVETCRARSDGTSAAAGCRGVQFGPACSVTVDEYFQCVTAWNATQRCDNAGMLIETPAACSVLTTACPKLAPAFFQAGAPTPCSTDGGAPAAATDGVVGDDGCRPVPDRLVVLGDSIANCCCLASPETECATFQIADYLRATWAPALAFESHAEAGAVTADLPVQAQAVSAGPGHVAVWIWAIGNDISAVYPRGQPLDYASLNASWAKVFSYFTDASRFPDGATFLLNTQYSPFDECPAAWGPDSANGVAEQLLREANRALILDVAEQRSDAIAVDQYPDWLGHGQFANVRGCPHCGADNTSWMGAGVHPNAAGFAHIAEKWKAALNRMYGARCHAG